MPYADRFFTEKLSIPVSIFNPLLAVQVGPLVDREKLASEAVYFGAVVGLALRQAGNCPVEVNLLPPSVKKDLDVRGRMPYLVAAVALWTLMFALLGGANIWRAMAVEKDLANLQKEMSGKTALSKKIETLNTDLGRLSLEVETFHRLKKQRDFWPTLLDVLNEKIPTGIWISSLQLMNGASPVSIPTAAPSAAPAGPARGPAPAAPQVLNLAAVGNEVLLRGYYEDQIDGSELNKFVDELKQTGLFEQVSIPDRESPNGDLIALRFTIVAKLKPDQILDLKP
jgi:Tfp pilus assembly protein PilN